MAVKKTQMYRRNLDGTETNLNPLTESQYVLMENGQTVQEVLSDRDSDKYIPVITNSSSTFKVGQGDNVDLSSSMKEGAYESCVLKGQTLVNDIGSFLKNAGSGVANVIQNNNDIEIEITTSGSQIVVYNLARGLKPNTKYLFKGIKEFTGANLMFGFDDGHYTLLTYEKINESYIVETGSSTSCLKFYIGYTGIMNVGDRLKIMNPLLLEYQERLENLDLPYFEGLCDVKSPILSNVGKNLFDYKSYGGQDINIVEIENGLRVSTWATSLPFTHNLLPNTKYTSKSVVKVIEEHIGATDVGAGKVYIYNGTTYFLLFKSDGGEYTFTTPSDIKSYNRILFYAHGGGGSKVGVVDITNMQLEEISSATAYEPYKSNTTTFDQKDGKTIVLRSLPNGACDTLNVETGEYVQGIGEIVLDGSENWEKSSVVNGRYYLRGLISSIVNTSSHICLNNKYASVTTSESDGGSKGLALSNGNMIMINTDFATLDEFKTSLKSDNVTLQYELATPIVSTIDVQGFPYAYKDGHVQLSSGHSGQSLTPKVEYSLSANKTGQINSNTKRVSAHQKQLDDFEAMMLTAMVDSAYDKAILQFDYEMQMMSLGGE